MALGGYANRVARIDLSSGTVSYEEINEADARLYIGARGLGVKYLLDNGATVDPTGPDNMLAFMNGPLTGSEATMSGRLAVVTKSPLTGTVTDSHMGGWSAARLRWAGFDALLFTGKAASPVYAYVEDGTVELRPADDLWGKGVHETIPALKDRYGDDLSVMAIGKSGENGILYASIINEDDRAAGRGGTGAVAGGKNLKAVVVKGTNATMPKPADRDKWRTAHQTALKTIMDSEVTGPNSGGLSVYGTNVLTNPVNSLGGMGTRNSQTTTFDRAEKVSGEAIKENFLVSEPTCHACPVACKKEVEIKDGPYAGLRMESFEYEPAWSLGANCDNDDVGVIAKVIDQCNDHGMDAIEIGNVLSMYMEATEKEFVTGPGLGWGDGAGMVATVEAIAAREGVGDALANGTAQGCRVVRAPGDRDGGEGAGGAGLRPTRDQGRGDRLCDEQSGSVPLAGLHAGVGAVGHSGEDGPAGVEGQGGAAENLPRLARVQRLAGFVQVLGVRGGRGRVRGAVRGDRGRHRSTGDDVMVVGERIYNLERYFQQLGRVRRVGRFAARAVLEGAGHRRRGRAPWWN